MLSRRRLPAQARRIRTAPTPASEHQVLAKSVSLLEEEGQVERVMICGQLHTGSQLGQMNRVFRNASFLISFILLDSISSHLFYVTYIHVHVCIYAGESDQTADSTTCIDYGYVEELLPWPATEQ